LNIKHTYRIKFSFKQYKSSETQGRSYIWTAKFLKDQI